MLDTVENQAGEALGQMYVKVAFPAESKARMQTLVQNLRDALKVRIDNLAWMSPETKKKALEKWATFTPKIGYPDKWRDWTGLATSRDSYIGNVLAANEFNYKWNLSQDRQAGGQDRMGHEPADGQRLLQPAAERDRVPGRDPAAAVLRPEGAG